MLAAEDLQGLNIPQDAKLVAISTEKQADGAQQWTLTYRLEPQSSSGIAPQGAPAPMAPHPACGSSSATAAPGLPPPPPPLNSAQILSKRESKNVIGSASLDSPGVAPFPVLPYQPGSPNRLFPLRCAVMTYAWGKIGADSLVGQLAASGDADFAIDENMPYSELWMGTHASGPSMVMLEEPYRIITPLYDWLKLNPFMRKSTKSNLTNEQQAKGSSAGLPFLFKVLSVRTALSIQAHPDKTLAEQLHAEKPSYYKDSNHKPEMALAVTPFEALCSFQKINSVLENLRACPELVAVVGEAAVGRLQAAAEKAAPITPAWPAQRWGRRGTAMPRHASPSPSATSPRNASSSVFSDEEKKAARAKHVVPALKEVFTRLMTADAALVERQLDSLMRRIAMTAPMLRAPVDELAARLHDQYKHDVGVFCAYLLNYLVLEPGEALFLAANEPHAYIHGDCVECMATSDNVIRAGLTPKFKDVDVLCASLTYDDGPPHMVASFSIAEGVQRYVTPAPEFLVDRVELPASSTTSLPPSPFVSIIVVLKGGGVFQEYQQGESANGSLVHEVHYGSVFMLCADTCLTITAGAGSLLLFRATTRYTLDDAY